MAGVRSRTPACTWRRRVPCPLVGSDIASAAPFRPTAGTRLVDDVRPSHAWLVAAGARIMVPLQVVPTTAAFDPVHPDGTVVEYLHHRQDRSGR